jgi:toxin ParE1/3/4
MPRISVRPTAASDLENDWYYIAQYSLTAADMWLDDIEDSFKTLLKSPYLGAERNAIMEGIKNACCRQIQHFLLP